MSADKIYERTENGTVTHVSIREGLDEINHAQMAGKRDVKTMSSITRTDFAIEYKDGRKVRLVRIDTPQAAPAEPEEWGTVAASVLAHKFHGEGPATRDADYRAKCNRSIRWYARPMSQTEGPRLRTRSEIEAVRFGSGEMMYRFCPRCEAK